MCKKAEGANAAGKAMQCDWPHLLLRYIVHLGSCGLQGSLPQIGTLQSLCVAHHGQPLQHTHQPSGASTLQRALASGLAAPSMQVVQSGKGRLVWIECYLRAADHLWLRESAAGPEGRPQHGAGHHALVDKTQCSGVEELSAGETRCEHREFCLFLSDIQTSNTGSCSSSGA